MNDDYLWDRSGEPDPEVERLERVLAPLRHDRSAPEFSTPKTSVPARQLRVLGYGLAAATVLAATVVWFLVRSDPSAWSVARVEGSPRIDRRSVTTIGALSTGQWLETDGMSRARITIGLIGEVEVGPNSRVRALTASATEHRLELQRGILHAVITAPPRLFFVNTPSAVAVDLGCAYTLEVDDAGAGVLRVLSGWVAFERGGRESFVPAGAGCATLPGAGPGTPYFEDASDRFRGALASLDFGGLTGGERDRALSTVLIESRPRDGLTLWHLLTRSQGRDLERVYDRLAELVPPPNGVTREGILDGDRSMLDRWWDQLGLDRMSWWRLWKRPWPPATH